MTRTAGLNQATSGQHQQTTEQDPDRTSAPSHQPVSTAQDLPRVMPSLNMEEISAPGAEFGGLQMQDVFLLLALGQGPKGSSVLQHLTTDVFRCHIAPAIASASDESRLRAGLKTPELEPAAATPLTNKIIESLVPPRVVRPSRVRHRRWSCPCAARSLLRFCVRSCWLSALRGLDGTSCGPVPPAAQFYQWVY
jgi:hypothetical protein